jgi:putative addiction module killer protein
VTQGAPADIREYLTEDGSSPFGTWFEGLDAPAAAKVTTAVARMEHGNLSHTKPVGKGVYENKIEYGPGYRIYFANDGERLIILLGGGTKKGQSRDIRRAQEYWKDFKQRKHRRIHHGTDEIIP